MSEELKTDETKIDWNRRHWDPMIRFNWNSATRVEPANKENGEHYGTTIYPDGTRSNFYVE